MSAARLRRCQSGHGRYQSERGMTLPEVMMIMIIFSLLVFPFIMITHNASRNAQSWETRIQESILLRKLLADIDPWHQGFNEDYDTTIGANSDPYDVPGTCPNNGRCEYLTVVDSNRRKLIYYVRRANSEPVTHVRTVSAYTYATATSPEYMANTPNFLSASMDVTSQEIYVLCGDTNAYIDAANNLWRPLEAFTDRWGYLVTFTPTSHSTSNPEPLFAHYVTTGAATSNVPDDGDPDMLFRFDLPKPENNNTIPRYQVELYMMEPTFTQAGERVFDVTVKGNKVATNLDLYAKAGNSPYVLTTVQSINDGMLVIGLENKHADSGSNNPVISAIHIRRVYQS